MARIPSGRPVHSLLAQYGQSHRHPTNELIHVICVPTIVGSMLCLLWALHPLAAGGAALAVLGYYFTLSTPLAWGMLLMLGGMLGMVVILPPQYLWQIASMLFVLAWIGQFIGHRIEGKKPSFLEDVRFLLIGPLFVLSFFYRRLGVAY